jgi:hypothetical protein
MGYRELPLGRKGVLTIDGSDYDVDWFGMDDGQSEDPGDAFRFIFQLGSGFMIYLYVIQAGARGDHRHFFHSFWTKDCAVADVEMEEHGPPREVRCGPIELPLLYRRVTVGGRAFGVVAQTFVTTLDERPLMTFELDGGARLSWDRRDGWCLAEPGAVTRPLAPDERLWFDLDPVS